MKKLLNIIFISTFLYSCSEKPQQEEKWHWLTIRGLYPLEEFVDTLQIYSKQSKDSLIIKYISKYSKMEYLIVENNNDTVFHSYESHSPTPRLLSLKADTVITITKEPVQVRVYESEFTALDAQLLHYWSPKYGMFMIHSSTWPRMSILQSNNSAINKEVLQIAEAIVPVFFKPAIEKQIRNLE